LIRASTPDSSLHLTVDPGEEAVVVTASTTCTGALVVEPGSFSWHVLSSLTDEVKTFTDGDGPDTGQVFGITLTTRRASLLR
nr:anti-sigma factor [Streptomyces sp. DSM 41633]